MSSCSGFAVMFLANLKNAKGLRVSGVGGCICARHRVWRANGIGDLQKGERCVGLCGVSFLLMGIGTGDTATWTLFSGRPSVGKTICVSRCHTIYLASGAGTSGVTWKILIPLSR